MVCAVAMAAIASACGTSNGNKSFPAGDGGSSSGGGGGDDAAGDVFGTFGDSGIQGHEGGGTPPPKGCDSSCPAAGGTCQNNVCVLTENPGGVDSTTQGQLQAGGSGDATFAWQYPYDKTVFPRGLIPPTMQFAGVAPSAYYVRITCASLDYHGYFKASSGPMRLALPPATWTAITNAASGPSDPLVVQVTKIAGGQVAGPITESWPVAQGSLRGAIYYETYGSQLAGGPASVGIMEIQPGAKQPTVLKKGCGNVCHTASADGSTLVASVSLLSSASYNLQTNVSTIATQPNERFTYGGIYPDGSFEMSATHYRTWLNTPSALYDTKTGNNIPALGWDGVIKHGGTTAFSPDGKQLAFVHEDKDAGHTIAKMDFTVGNHSFANLVDLATDPSLFLGWPAYTPDGKWVVFQEAQAASTAAFETDGGNHADLFAVDVATKTVARLDALDGYTGSGTASYLPAKDPNLSFAPTVLPEAVGGYYWVVFTSHRSYGNTLGVHGPRGRRDGRRARTDVGRRARPEPHARPRRQPPRVLPRRPGAGGGQPARLLGPSAVRAERRRLHHRRPVLQRLLPPQRGRRPARVRLAPRRVLERVREVLHVGGLLQSGLPVHQRPVRAARRAVGAQPASGASLGASEPPSPGAGHVVSGVVWTRGRQAADVVDDLLRGAGVHRLAGAAVARRRTRASAGRACRPRGRAPGGWPSRSAGRSSSPGPGRSW